MRPFAIVLAALPMLALACARSGEAGNPDGGAGSAECTTDDDCGLMPAALTCCGECPPAPPFEPVPRTAIDAALLEHETQCAGRTLACVDTPACDPVPAGCAATAVCDRGRCRLVERGCLPLARGGARRAGGSPTAS